MLYKITVTPQHPSSPTLSLRSTTPLTFSPTSSVLLESSDLALHLFLKVDGSKVSAEEALESGCLVDIRSWFEEHKLSLGFDRTSLVLSSTTATLLLSSTPRQPLPLSALLLPSLSLKLSFRSPSTPSHLHSQLLTTPLHFSLRPLLRTALAKFATQLSTTFPLIFNPTWTTRLTNDLPTHSSLSTSLSSLLSSATPSIAAAASQLIASGGVESALLRCAMRLERDKVVVRGGGVVKDEELGVEDDVVGGSLEEELDLGEDDVVGGSLEEEVRGGSEEELLASGSDDDGMGELWDDGGGML